MNDIIPALPADTASESVPQQTYTTAGLKQATRNNTSWVVWLILFILFLLSAAGAGSAFYLWMQSSTTTTLQQQHNETLEKQVASLQKTIADNKESDGRFRQQTIHILTENSEKLRSLDRIDTSYWRLAEAEFLLKQAHQRLFITHDAETADLLLASADAAIMQQKDPGLLPARSAIAADRAALRKVPRVDHDGLYLRLQALSSQVGLLASANRFLEQDTESQLDETASYRDMLLNRLMSIVRIRHHDHPVEPLLPPEQEVYLRQNLQLSLVQAQLGLLQNQQQTYTSNLERVDAWVRQYCQTEDPLVQTWLNELNTLMRFNIAPDLPDISGSLRTVEKIIETRAEEIQRSLLLEDDDNDAGENDNAAPVTETVPSVTAPIDNATTDNATTDNALEANSPATTIDGPQVNSSEVNSPAPDSEAQP